MQLKGVLPKDWNCHHLRCKFLNGGNEIENLSIIEKWNHRCLHDSLNHILDAQSELYGVDMEFMEGYAKKFGAYTLNDYKAKAKTNNVPTLRTLKNKKRKQIRLEI